MRVLVTGVRGQLGYDVIQELRRRKIDCLGADIEEFDITDYAATEKFIDAYKPNVVIHCSAYTAVDKAEDDVARCEAVNVKGPENIAKICKKCGAKMVYISTDYVFPGTGDCAYETDAHKEPQSVYGRTKLAGEEAVQTILENYFVVRISWVFGKNGNNFVKTMLRLAQDRSEMNVVCDQIGSPTYTADLAPLLCDMIETEKYGIYHATNEGDCSWAEFAKAIFQKAGCNIKVNEITSDQYPAKAKRPLNSRLSKRSLDAAGFSRLPAWQDALERYLTD